MSTLIKSLIKLTFGVILIFFVIIIGVITFINPLRFKGPIEEQIYTQTGRKFSIDGPIRWRIVPWVVLEAKDISLQNAKGFDTPFLTANTARFRIEFLPLFVGKIVLDAQLKSPELSLEKKSNTVNNWEDLKQKFASKQEAAKGSSRKKPSIYLNGIKIENGTITWQDNTTHQHYYLKNVNLSAENLFTAIGNSSTPIAFNADIQNQNFITQASLYLSADWYFNRKSKEISLNHLKFLLTTKDKKELLVVGQIRVHQNEKPYVIEGNIQIPNRDLEHWLPQSFIARNENANDNGNVNTNAYDNGNVNTNAYGNGNSNANDNTNTNANGNTNETSNDTQNNTLPKLSRNANTQMDFKFKNPILEVSNLTLSLERNGAIDGHFSINPFEFSLDNPILEGEFSAKNIHIQKWNITDLKTTVSAKKKFVQFAPFNLSLQNNPFTGSLVIHLDGDTPKYALEETGTNIDFKTLLSPLTSNDFLEGQGSLKTKLYFSGKSMQDFLNSLSGQTRIEIGPGKFIGMNLSYLLQHVQSTAYSAIKSLQKKQLLNIPPIVKKELALWKAQNLADIPLETSFNAITATFIANHGIVSNPDLHLSATHYSVNGKGLFNLPKQTLDYTLLMTLNDNPSLGNDDLSQFLKETPITIHIKGDLLHPTVRPEIEPYLQSAFKFSTKNIVEKFVNKAVNKALKKVLPMPIPVPTPEITQSSPETTNPSPETTNP